MPPTRSRPLSQTGVLAATTNAVLWAAFFNFVAVFVFHLKVATTIGKGTIDPAIVDQYRTVWRPDRCNCWNVITGISAFRHPRHTH